MKRDFKKRKHYQKPVKSRSETQLTKAVALCDQLFDTLLPILEELSEERVDAPQSQDTSLLQLADAILIHWKDKSTLITTCHFCNGTDDKHTDICAVELAKKIKSSGHST